MYWLHPFLDVFRISGYSSCERMLTLFRDTFGSAKTPILRGSSPICTHANECWGCSIAGARVQIESYGIEVLTVASDYSSIKGDTVHADSWDIDDSSVGLPSFIRHRDIARKECSERPARRYPNPNCSGRYRHLIVLMQAPPLPVLSTEI